MAIDNWWTGAANGTQAVVEFYADAVVNSQDYTVTINGLAVTYHSDSSATATEIGNGLYSLLAAHTDPRITSQTYAAIPITSPAVAVAVQITGNEDGTPFTVTYSGTGGASLATIANITGTSDHDWAVGPNWATGSIPSAAQNVVIDSSSSDIYYNLNRSGDGTLASLTIGANFTGTIGMPSILSDLGGLGYWHPPYLTLKATTVNVGGSGGGGSGRIKWDAINGYSATLNVFSSGSGAEDGVEAVLFRSSVSGDTHVINVISGEVGVAVLAGDVAGVATLRAGPGAAVRCGNGTTLGTLNQDGGTVTLLCGVTTVNKIDGTLTVFGTGAVTTLNNDGGTTVYNSSGTITTLKVSNGGTIDFGQDVRPVTVTNCTIESGATLLDPFRRVTFTNGITLSRASLQDVTIDVGTHVTLTVAAGP